MLTAFLQLSKSEKRSMTAHNDNGDADEFTG